MSTQPNTILNVFRIIGERRVPYILELDATMTVVSDYPDLPLLKQQTAAMPLPRNAPIDVTFGTADVASVINAAAAQAAVGRAEDTLVGKVQAAIEARKAAATAAVADAVASGNLKATSNAMILATHPELSMAGVESNPTTIREDFPELAPSLKGEIVSEEKLEGGGRKIVYKPTASDIKVGEWVVASIEQNPLPGTDELRAAYFEAERLMKEKHAADGTVCKPCEAGALIRKYRAKLDALGVLP